MKRENNQKTRQTEKRFSVKKIPRVYRKQYTQKQFHKKLHKHLYVGDDRTFVENYFVTDTATGKLLIPADTLFTKKDVVRLKRIAKEIKQQKGTIKFVPLVAVVCFCGAVGISVTLFKNVFIKWALTSAMQKIFSAKTDIVKVDMRIFDASLSVTGIAQASRSEPMKNLFELERVTIDFNLTDLLRGKAHIEDITVAGIAWNIDRATSGALPRAAKKTDRQTSGFIADKTKALSDDVRTKLQATFAEYNPVNIAQNLQTNFQSPELAKEIQQQVEEKIAAWQSVPDEVRSSVESFVTSGQELISTDWSRMDSATVRSTLTTVNTVITQGKELKERVSSIAAAVQEDADIVQTYAARITEAVSRDRALVEEQVSKIAALKTTGLHGIMDDMLETVIYSLSGQYYPYVQQVLNMARAAQAQSANTSSPKKKKKSFTVSRLAGRDIYYKKDIVPRFLLEQFYTSGPNFSAAAHDVSSNMDLWGKPAVIDGAVSIGEHDNTLLATVDARSTATSLIDAAYTGTNYAIAVSAPAFGIASRSGITARVLADTDGGFTANGILDMHNLHFATEAFEPDAVYRLYERALSKITDVQLGFTFKYATDGDIAVQLSSDADRRLLSVLTELFREETASLIASVRTQLLDELDERTSGVTEKIAAFTGIQTDTRGLSASVNGVDAQLENLKKELAAQIQKQATESLQAVAGDALQQAAGGLVPEGAGTGAANGSENTGSTILRGIFGGGTSATEQKDDGASSDAGTPATGGNRLRSLFGQ